MPEITVVTRECCELVDITRRIAALVPPDLGSGLCSVHSLHTTAALTVNENADPDVQHDLLPNSTRSCRSTKVITVTPKETAPPT